LAGLAFTLIPADHIHEYLAKTGTAEAILGGTAFVSACFVTGFLLGGVARWIFHYWRPRNKLSTLREQYGSTSDQASELEGAFRAYFGFELSYQSTDPEYIASCGRLCRLAVSANDPALDAQLARVDAEECLSQALMAGSAILALLSIYFHRFVLSGLYCAVFVTSLSSFFYYRRKVLRERLQAFLVLSRDRETRSRNASATGERE
jgi:hypothetical protein